MEWRGYFTSQFQRDVGAGITVGVVAIPLSMGLAIACGLPPQYGLFTAIIAGAAIALTGGARTTISGPTAAFVALLAPLVAAHGLAGLALATLMAGAIQVGLGVFRFGRFVEFVPHPVTTGFTAGIAIVIALLQLPDLVGISPLPGSVHPWQRLGDVLTQLELVRWRDLACGLVTLAVLLSWPRRWERVPSPLPALIIAALVAVLLESWWPGTPVETLGTRFTTWIDGVAVHGVPRTLPRPTLPWLLPGAGGGAAPGLSWQLVRELLPAAGAIAALGAIESLLAAVVADGMAGTRHDPDAELVGQGIGNLLCPFFGGFAATGALARTAVSIRQGGRTPIAGVVHAAFVLGAMLLFAPLLAYLPMAGLAGMLLVVAWHMSDARNLAQTLRVAPGGDVAVLLVCLILTVMFDMVLAIGVGIVLAALLFLRRMVELAGVRLVSGSGLENREPLPDGVVLYEITGPMFFGAASKAMALVGGGAQVVIIDMAAVPTIDATGLTALASALGRLQREHVAVILCGLQKEPRMLLRRAELTRQEQDVHLRSTRAESIELAAALCIPPDADNALAPA